MIRRSKWAGAIREWSAYEITTDCIWWRWDAIGIDRKGDFVQFYVYSKQFGAMSKRRVAGMRRTAVAALKGYAQRCSYVPIAGALDLPDGAREARFL